MTPESADLEARRHQLLSPEGVRLDFVLAGPAPRIFAYAIDFVIIMVLMALLFAFLATVLPLGGAIDHWMRSHLQQLSSQARSGHPNPQALGAFEGVIIAVVVLAQFVVEFGYFTFFEMVTNGRSPGKAAIGLRVVRRDGNPIDLRGSLVRNVMRLVDMLPAYYLIGLISIVLSPRSERLGDHVAGTIVLRLDRPEAAAEIDTGPDSPALALTREQLARIGARELRLIRSTLRRVDELPDERGEELLREVAGAIRARLDIAESSGQDARAFLREVLGLAERYSRGRA